MASEQAKTPAEQQPAQPTPPVIPYPAPYGAHPYPVPHGAFPPPYYTYAPMPPEANHDPNAPNGAPQAHQFIVPIPPPPPGLVYAYAPPGHQPMMFPPYGPPPMSAPRPKRKQVKMACTNCAAACKRCDDTRPCERCQKYGIAESCVDGIRKERKKGVKRGPYKRKSKNSSEGMSPAGSPGEGEASATPAAYPMPPEGYYSPFYYPHTTFAPHPHETQGNGEGSVSVPPPAHPVPQTFFPLHPAYPPPYGQFPPGTVPYPPPPNGAPATAAPADVSGKGAESASEANGEASGDKSKKRSRSSKTNDDGKKKKSKDSRAEANGTNGHSEAPTEQQASPVEPSSYTHAANHGAIANGAENRHVVSPV